MLLDSRALLYVQGICVEGRQGRSVSVFCWVVEAHQGAEARNRLFLVGEGSVYVQ